MASDIQYNPDDERTKIMQEILESSKEGLTKQQMLDRSGLSYQQLREITAELADKKFLRYIEPDETYITTDKGLIFLDATKGTEKGTVNKSMPSYETKNDQLR
ncbi:MAG: winged helix-turn-helix domain-containing protein [Thermoproteota archaeon]|nr:winged helix-turn-helix domain-containing protein [Thermoproteota archaeon]